MGLVPDDYEIGQKVDTITLINEDGVSIGTAFLKGDRVISTDGLLDGFADREAIIGQFKHDPYSDLAHGRATVAEQEDHTTGELHKIFRDTENQTPDETPEEPVTEGEPDLTAAIDANEAANSPEQPPDRSMGL